MMEAIRSYLTAVVAVSMIAVLASALAHGSRMERVGVGVRRAQKVRPSATNGDRSEVDVSERPSLLGGEVP